MGPPALAPVLVLPTHVPSLRLAPRRPGQATHLVLSLATGPLRHSDHHDHGEDGGGQDPRPLHHPGRQLPGSTTPVHQGLRPLRRKPRVRPPFRVLQLASRARPHADSDAFVRDFQNCLKELDMFNGETLYGFRVENAISAALERESDAVIMAAGGWRTADSARHYSQFAIAAAHVGEGQNPITTAHEWLTNITRYSYFQ
ncbi:hypothetical protein BDR26DRAFT_928966 [Obelidium mucronatum]|nr:hypothetical protein BDR26DRAFT_928966 [Obelidium mucronatum]